MKVILQIRKSRELGTTNPLPFVVTILNCIGWVVYSALRKDIFIFLANVSGLCLGLFYTLNCMTVLVQHTKANEELNDTYRTLEGLLVFAAFFWALIGFLCAMIFNNFSDPVEQMATLVGFIGSSFAIAYYGAPLSTMANVIMTRDSSSLYLPTTVINIANASLWTAYGFAVMDINIWGPNFIGLILSASQVVLIAIFPRKVAHGNVSIPLEEDSHYKESTSIDRKELQFSDILEDGRRGTRNPLH
jgi:solute carrier family 50 protein (sugar transporter)